MTDCWLAPSARQPAIVQGTVRSCRPAGAVPRSEFLLPSGSIAVMGGLPLAEHGGLPSRPRVGDTNIPGVFVAGDWVGLEGHLADAALSSGESAGQAAAHHALQQPSLAGIA